MKIMDQISESLSPEAKAVWIGSDRATRLEFVAIAENEGFDSARIQFEAFAHDSIAQL